MFRQASSCAVIAAIRSPAASRPDGVTLLAGPGAEGGRAPERPLFFAVADLVCFLRDGAPDPAPPQVSTVSGRAADLSPSTRIGPGSGTVRGRRRSATRARRDRTASRGTHDLAEEACQARQRMLTAGMTVERPIAHGTALRGMPPAAGAGGHSLTSTGTGLVR